MSPPNRDHDDLVCSSIAAYRSAKGYGPSFREVADSIDMSLSATAAIIRRLIDEGRLTHTPRIPRTLRVVHEEETIQCGT